MPKQEDETLLQYLVRLNGHKAVNNHAQWHDAEPGLVLLITATICRFISTQKPAPPPRLNLIFAILSEKENVSQSCKDVSKDRLVGPPSS